MAKQDSGEWAPVHILPPLEFDLSPESSKGSFGKSDAPLTVLPPVPFDLSEPDQVPILQLTLHIRPGVDPTQLALDVLGLVDALNSYERDLGGKGVNWDKAHSRAEPERGVIYLVLVPNELLHARERLARLVAATNGVSTAPMLAANGQSFGRWEAAIGSNAA